MGTLAVLLAVLAVAVPVHRTAWANEPVVTISVTDINYETATASFTVTGLPDSVTPTNWIASVNYKAPPDRYGHTLRAGPGKYSETQDDFTAVLSGNTLTADIVHLTRLIPDSEHTLTVTIMQRVGRQSPERAKDSTTFTAESGCSPSPEPNHKDPESISPTKASWFGIYEFRHVTETEFMLEVSLNPSFERKHAPVNSGACVYYKYDEPFGTFQSGIITAYIHDNLSGGKRGAFIRHTGLTPATRYGFRLTMDKESDVGDITVYGTTLGPNTGIDEITFTDITQNRARATATIENASSDPKFGYWHYRKSPIDGEPEGWGSRSEKLTEGATFPIELDNLDAGTRYELEASVKDNFNPNMSMTKAFVTLPGKPGISPLEAGDGSLKVTWTAPTEGAATITGYRVQWQETEERFTSEFPPPTLTLDDADVDEDDTSYTITGLTNGINYIVHVIAKNESGGTSSDDAFGTPMSIPNAPNNLQVAEGNEKLALTWEEPTAKEGVTITDYVVEYKENAAQNWTSSNAAIQTISDTQTYLTIIPDLTNDTLYDVQVRADNGVTSDNYEWATGSGTPVPGPSIRTVTVDLNSVTQTEATATVTIDRANDSTQTILLQHRTLPSGGWSTPAITDTTATGSKNIRITGLTGNTEYEVQAWLQTNVATKVKSLPFTTSPVVPEAPDITSVAHGDRELTVTWTAPSETGGADIEYFVVQWKPNTVDWTSPLVQDDSTIDETVLTSTITGLSNGTTYDIRVRADNGVVPEAGQDYNWDEHFGTPDALPGKPIIQSVAEGNTQLVVTWDEPANTGSDITGYVVQWKNNSVSGWESPLGSSTLEETDFTHTITSLANGTEYAVRVRAVNGLVLPDEDEDDYNWSDDETGTPRPEPIVTGVTVAETSITRTTATATVDIDNRTDDGQTVHLQYRKTTESGWTPVSPKDVTATATSETFDLSSLTGNTNYVVEAWLATANNIKASATFKTGPVEPDAPRNVEITGFGDGELTVAWDAPLGNGGSTITGYKVQWKEVDTLNWDSPSEESDDASPYTIENLTNGARYDVRVLAVNDVGDGPPSGDVEGTPSTRPKPPTITDITHGHQKLTVTWTAPTGADTGGSDITGYIVQWKWGTNDYNTTYQATPPASPYEITNLINGTEYTVRVFAVNESYPDDPSDESNEVPGTPSTVPQPPTDVTITGFGDESLTVSWTAPTGIEDTGGSPITGFKIQWKLNSQTGWSTYEKRNDQDNQSPYTITETLENGTKYDVRVIAVNKNDDSRESESATGTPSRKPDAPTGVDITDYGNGWLEVTWNAVTGTDTGGSPIKNYIVQWKSGANYDTTNQATPPPMKTTYKITNLKNGTEYTVRLLAVNETYPNDPSDDPDDGTNEDKETPRTKPKPPTGVNISEYGDGYLKVAWTAPEDNGGSDLTEFKVQWKESSVSGWDSPSEETVNAVSGKTDYETTISSLTNGTEYTVRVLALNGNRPTDNTSDTSNTASGTPSTTPDAPTSVTITNEGDRTLTVTWEEPDNGGTDITKYKVQWKERDDANAEWTSPTDELGASARKYVIRELTNGVWYTVQVFARNEHGLSAQYGQVTGRPSTKPDPPTDVEVSAHGDGWLKVTWTELTETEKGGLPTTYIVQWKSGLNYSETDKADPATSPQKITNLENGTLYTVRVLARNDRGTSDDPGDGTNVDTGTPMTKPQKPTDVTITDFGNESLTVAWAAPTDEDTGGAPITGFKIQWKLNSDADWNTNTYTEVDDEDGQSPYTINQGLSNGIKYDVRVLAVNGNTNTDDNTSDPSNSATGTPSRKPNSPTGVDITDYGNKWLKVTWDAVIDEVTGGSDIKNYIVQWKSGTDDYNTTNQATPEESPYTITNLDNGTLYTVRVLAVNETYPNDPSDDPDDGSNEDSETPRTIPEKPTDLEVISGDKQLTVSWTAPVPEKNGGAGVDRFIVQWKSGNQEYHTSRQETPSNTSQVIKPLTNGTPYSIQVRADNGEEPEVGQDYNWEETTGTPMTVPGAPTDLEVEEGDEQLKVSWVAPTETGGLDIVIDHFVIQWQVKGGNWSSPDEHTTTDGNKLTDTITGLDNGTDYDIRVRADNDVEGQTFEWAYTSGKPRTIPGLPTSLRVAPGDRQLTLSWVAPADNGGLTINRYIVQWKSGIQEYDTSRQATPTITSQVIGQLANGTPHFVRVRADNGEEADSYNWATGNGTPAAAQNPPPPPPPQQNNPPPQRSPQNPTPPPQQLSPKVASVSVTNETQTTADATVKIDNAGTAQNTVNLRYSVDGENSWTDHTETETGSVVEFPLSSLTAGTTYEVEAWLGSDTDNKATATFTTTQAAAVTPPSISSVRVRNVTQTSARVVVGLASVNAGQRVYLQYKLLPAQWPTSSQNTTHTNSIATFNLSSLTAGTGYHIRVSLNSDMSNATTRSLTTLPQQQNPPRQKSPVVPPPSVSSVTFDNITQTAADATVNIAHPGTAKKTVRLQYRVDGTTAWSTPPKSENTSGSNATFAMTNLTAATTYEVQAWLNTNSPPSGAQIYTFTTLANDPGISNLKMENIRQTSATAMVEIADAGTEMKEIYLKHSIDDTDEWSQLPFPTITYSDSTSINLTGLEEKTTYQVMVDLTDGFDKPKGSTFTTLAAPSLSGVSISSITQTGAVATATIADAGTAQKTVHLRYREFGETEWNTAQTKTTTGASAAFNLTGLDPRTTYEVQASLDIEFGTSKYAVFTTLSPDPSVSGVSVGSITQTSATATMTIAYPGIARKTVRLRYRVSGETEWGTVQTKVTSKGSAAIDLTGLSPRTTYEVEASLSSDFADSKTAIFSTLSLDPSVSGVSIGSITQTSAAATVTIANPGTAQKTVYLQYRVDGASGWSDSALTATTDEPSATVYMTGLISDMEYEVRASLASDFALAQHATFSTLRYPSIYYVDVTDITKTTATAEIDIADPDGSSQTVHLRHRTTTPQGEWSSTFTTASTTAEASIDLTGLTVDTEYEVEASLTADFAIAVSDTFRTLPPDPVVAEVSVNNIRQTTATAAIDIANSTGSSQPVSLRYRTTTPRGNWSDIQTTTSTTDSASIDLSELTPGTEYDVQASLENSFPSSRTKHDTFTTLRWPSIASFEAENVARNGATVSATIADSRGVAQTVYVRHRATGYIAWRSTQQMDSVDDIASLRLRGLSSGTEYTAEASLDSSFPDGGTMSVTFTTVKRDDDDDASSSGSGIAQAARSANIPLLGFSPHMLRFVAIEGGDNPAPQAFSVWNRAQGSMSFNLSNHEEWLSQQPMSGVSNGPDDSVTITASVDSSELASGQYVDVINIDVTSSGKSPGQVIVVLDVLPPDYIRQFVSRDDGGVVVLPDGTVKIVVQPESPPKDVDIELMKLNLQAHGQPPGEQERVVVAIESNTYEPGGDTPEDVAYAPYVELWVQLPQEDAAACDESRARVYSVQSGAWSLIEHRCETDDSGHVWAVTQAERLGQFALVIDDAPVAATPTPVAAAVVPTATAIPASAPAVAVQRLSLPAQPPTPVPASVPTAVPVPNGKTTVAPAMAPTPTPTAVPAGNEPSASTMQATAGDGGSGGFGKIILAALGVPMLIGALIVVYLLYRERRRRDEARL